MRVGIFWKDPGTDQRKPGKGSSLKFIVIVLRQVVGVRPSSEAARPDKAVLLVFNANLLPVYVAGLCIGFTLLMVFGI